MGHGQYEDCSQPSIRELNVSALFIIIIRVYVGRWKVRFVE